MNKKLENHENSLKYIEELEKVKLLSENELIELRKKIANNPGMMISEDIELLEDDLKKEYEKKMKNFEELTEKKFKEKFISEYEEKMRLLKENYEKEIQRMQQQIKNIGEEYENQTNLRISSEYEKKLLEIKNKYEIEIASLNEKLKEIEEENEKNNENVNKNIKKGFNNEKKGLMVKIEKLSDEKNLLLQEKNAWEEILKKNSKVFEKIPSFFTSSSFFNIYFKKNY